MKKSLNDLFEQFINGKISYQQLESRQQELQSRLQQQLERDAKSSFQIGSFPNAQTASAFHASAFNHSQIHQSFEPLFTSVPGYTFRKPTVEEIMKMTAQMIETLRKKQKTEEEIMIIMKEFVEELNEKTTYVDDRGFIVRPIS